MSSAKPIRPTVISGYRTTVDIGCALQEVCERPSAVDEAGRLHALGILDDLAEELIGRRDADTPGLTVQIRHERARWVGTAPPVTGSATA